LFGVVCIPITYKAFVLSKGGVRGVKLSTVKQTPEKSYKA